MEISETHFQSSWISAFHSELEREKDFWVFYLLKDTGYHAMTKEISDNSTVFVLLKQGTNQIYSTQNILNNIIIPKWVY